MNCCKINNVLLMIRHSKPLKQVKQVRQLNNASQTSGAIFLSKQNEPPILFIPEAYQIDLIGPPNPISNLRPIIRHPLRCETVLQRKLRKMQDRTQAWNEKFWHEHNTKFKNEKENFIKCKLKPGMEQTTLTADEMSEFYKHFLDKNWKNHVQYNFEWYKRNFAILLLTLRVNLNNSIQSILSILDIR